MTKRWFRFAYYVLERDGRDPLPHQLRDADAALFLSEALAAQGYRYAGPILNHPVFGARPDQRLPNSSDVEKLSLNSNDLLVLTTRPPIDDWREGGSRPIPESFTVLEGQVFAKLKEHLPVCSRKEITVAERHAERWYEVAERHHVRFDQNRRDGGLGASIKELKPHGDSRFHPAHSTNEKTLAYLVYERQVWPGGPGIMCLFGLGGTETVGWAYRLASDANLRKLIGTQPFVMAEIMEHGRPTQPGTLGFADAWKVVLLTSPDDV